MSSDHRLGRSRPEDTDLQRGFMAGVRACAHHLPCFDAWAGDRVTDCIARGLLEEIEDISQDPGEDLCERDWLKNDIAPDQLLSQEIAEDVYLEIFDLLAPAIGEDAAEIASTALKGKLESLLEKSIDQRIRLHPRTEETPPIRT